MSVSKTTRGTGEWAVISMPGTLYENMNNVLEVLEKGKGKSAKVAEGSDSTGAAHTFVIIRGYKS